jgi:hypothetical protein
LGGSPEAKPKAAEPEEPMVEEFVEEEFKA